MKSYLKLLTAGCALLFCSCTGSNTAEDEPVLKIDPTSLTFDATGELPQTVAVTANVEWSAAPAGSASEWLTVDKTDDKTVTVTAKANPSTESRSAKIVVSATTAKVKSKEISVTQQGARKGDMSISVAPAALTFAGENAPSQEITVTVVGEGLEWTAAPEEGASWLHLEPAEGKITVTADNNPTTFPRGAVINITPSEKSVEPKTVKVTQEGKIVLPSLSIEPNEEIRFTADDLWQHQIQVNAVETGWNATTSTTSDGKGDNVPWIMLEIRNSDGESFLRVSSKKNPTLEERSGFVVITATKEGIDPFIISVTQEAGKEHLSTLTGDVAITDMTVKSGHNEVQFFPNSPGDDQPYIPDPDPENPDAPVTPIPGRSSAKWDLLVWGDNLTYDTNGWPFVYRGSGNRLKLDIRSERILYNADGEYYLPEGEYTVALNEDEAANTITYGQKNPNGDDEIFPRGSWYYRVENDATTAAAPITGGNVTVTRNGEEYTLTFDLVDDAGNKITGTCTAVFEMQVMYFPPDGDIGGGGGEV